MNEPTEGYGRPLRPIPAALDGLDELMTRVERMEKRAEAMMLPVMDLVQSVNESRVGFELEVFGYTILRLKSKVQPKLGATP